MRPLHNILDKFSVSLCLGGAPFLTTEAQRHGEFVSEVLCSSYEMFMLFVY